MSNSIDKDKILKLVQEKVNIDYEIKLTEIHNDSEVLIVPKISDAFNGDVSKVKTMKIRQVMKIYNSLQSNIYEHVGVTDKDDFMMITLVIAKKGETTQYIEDYKKVEINVEGNNIKLYRKKAGFSNQKDFADQLGIEQQTLSAFETERFQPRRNDITPILQILENVTYDELFNTGRLSVYISPINQKLIKEYMGELSDVFSKNNTDYENYRLIVNLILRIFLEGDNRQLLKDKIQSELL